MSRKKNLFKPDTNAKTAKDTFDDFLVRKREQRWENRGKKGLIVLASLVLIALFYLGSHWFGYSTETFEAIMDALSRHD
ncbi:hypothetical protein [Marinococcus sp. PL1-022]|uniref:hypothetical protein n=1 Tax=Marinococcus sp. PL1-022 TaxID=3095363 RepID=UPI0029C1AEC0|nr:hypothetical protein [Marinococcus sp. PL1-022]MDX6154515.1 hypothetical protein [Marinococcus sp. PL1-022]